MANGWWCFRSRRRRLFLVFLFSPVIIPLLCFSFPFLCVIAIYFFLRSKRSMIQDDGDLRRCEEGIEGRLFQMYLQDQLDLVGSVYNCGENAEDYVDKSDFLLA